MANKDYFDRIADALQRISGDDSHVDDVDKNMDYYKRIAEALENIAESGGSGGGGSGAGPLIVYDDGNGTLDRTWQEIHDAELAFIRDFGGIGIVTSTYFNDRSLKFTVAMAPIGSGSETTQYTTSSADGYPESSEGSGPR